MKFTTRDDSRQGQPADASHFSGPASSVPLHHSEQPNPVHVNLVRFEPGVEREVDLVRKSDELVLTVGSHRRVIALPSVLTRCIADGAALRDGRLRVRFRPDPELWMRG